MRKEIFEELCWADDLKCISLLICEWSTIAFSDRQSLCEKIQKVSNNPLYFFIRFIHQTITESPNAQRAMYKTYLKVQSE